MDNNIFINYWKLYNRCGMPIKTTRGRIETILETNAFKPWVYSSSVKCVPVYIKHG